MPPTPDKPRSTWGFTFLTWQTFNASLIVLESIKRTKTKIEIISRLQPNNQEGQQILTKHGNPSTKSNLVLYPTDSINITTSASPAPSCSPSPSISWWALANGNAAGSISFLSFVIRPCINNHQWPLPIMLEGSKSFTPTDVMDRKTYGTCHRAQRPIHVISEWNIVFTYNTVIFDADLSPNLKC